MDSSDSTSLRGPTASVPADRVGRDLALESIGIVVYGGAAVAGYLRRPWLIGAGIIAHGLGWDLWHHGRSSYVPDWYSAACLVVDLGVGAFALAYLRRAGESEPISPATHSCIAPDVPRSRLASSADRPAQRSGRRPRAPMSQRRSHHATAENSRSVPGSRSESRPLSLSSSCRPSSNLRR